MVHSFRYMCRSGKKDQKYENGSERFPFPSIKMAHDCYETYGLNASTGRQLRDYEGDDGHKIHLECGPDCQLRECFYPSCKRKICDDHGTGQGDEDCQGYGRGDIVFYRCKCLGCDKVACRVHQRHFRECDVCRNGYSANASLGAYNASPDACFKLCQDCGEDCGDEDAGGERCEFYCCPKCLDDHKCNDDPTEYC